MKQWSCVIVFSVHLSNQGTFYLRIYLKIESYEPPPSLVCFLLLLFDSQIRVPAGSRPDTLHLPPQSAHERAANPWPRFPTPGKGKYIICFLFLFKYFSVPRRLVGVTEVLLTSIFPELEAINPGNERTLRHPHFLSRQTNTLTSSLFDFISITMTGPETAKTIATINFFLASASLFLTTSPKPFQEMPAQKPSLAPTSQIQLFWVGPSVPTYGQPWGKLLL